MNDGHSGNDENGEDRPYLTRRDHPRWSINVAFPPRSGQERTRRISHEEHLEYLGYLKAATPEISQVSHWFQKELDRKRKS